MKHWKQGSVGNGYGDKGFILKDGDMDRVVSIAKTREGAVRFLEECDGCFGLELTKEEAVEMLKEAVEIVLS